MNNYEKDYSALLIDVLENGEKTESRNSIVFKKTACQLRVDLSEGLPVVTGKKIFPRSSFVEIEWLLSGDTNTKFLNDNGVKIWDQWSNKNGDLGPVYGKQLVDFNGVNQLKELMNQLKTDPMSRRHLVSMWNPSELSEMALPPCHYSFQIVSYSSKLDLVVSMRSLDLFIGLPYDMLMYSVILSAICKELNKIPGEVIINAADCHVYEEHIESAMVYAERKKYELPKLLKVPIFSKFNFKEVEISDYKTNPRLKVNVLK